MLACIVTGRDHAEIKEVPIPKLHRGEVLVKLAVAGICGTDIEKLHGGYGPGGVLGHEVSGTVAGLGSDVRNLNESDKVIAHHHVPCYKCSYCLRGNHTMCDLFKETNFDPCGLAEYFRIPEANVARGAVIRLPDKISLEEAALVEPTACCLRALNRAGVGHSDTVLIMGLGPTGLTQVQLLRHSGFSTIICADVLQSRLEMARKFGASETLDPSSKNIVESVKNIAPDGVDLSIVSTGNPTAILPALESVRKGGKLLLFGAPPLGSRISLDVNDLFRRQISIITSYSCVESDMHQTLELLARRALDLKPMITDRFVIKDASRALENARTSKTAVKTVIESER